MKRFKTIIIVTAYLLISQICQAYTISISEHIITVKMEHPSVGIVGLNAVHWSDDPDEIGREIYDSFIGFLDSRKRGNYTVKVYWKVKDNYGNNKLEYAGSYSFSAEELRKYENYYYSKHYRNVPSLIYQMAFPDGTN